MIKQLSYALLFLFLFSSCENRYRRGGTSAQPQASVDSKFIGKTNGDAYQVSQSEYDANFVTRYGLLYLKASQDPFSGRVLTVNFGESGEYVSSDESWKEGRKHGNCSKWFSNGIKMYERNYQDGRWHGSVTRWWPNGQKMYVRAYTNGVRHGKEATWRSDGTPLSLSDNEMPKVEQVESSSTQLDKVLPVTDLSNSAVLPETDNSSGDFSPDNALIPQNDDMSDLPGLPDVNTAEASEDDFSDLPSFPPMEEGLPGVDEPSSKLPFLPNASEPEVVLSGLEEAPSVATEEPLLPVLPGADDGALPALPDFDEPEASSDPGLPDLPGAEDSEGLPPLPGMEDEGGLPPLPSIDDEGGLPPLPGIDDGGFDDLPTLPPLP
jgi:hypothetical protein